ASEYFETSEKVKQDLFEVEDELSKTEIGEKKVRFIEKQDQSFGSSLQLEAKISGRPSSLVELVESTSQSRTMNRQELTKFLNHFGSFPQNKRPLIWKILLRIPENRDSYEALMEKGLHPGYRTFQNNYPMKSSRLSSSTERILSGLAYWSPIFENLEYLPGLVFPFVNLFVGDTFFCFEALLTIMVNWCQKWWEYYPNPPIECLDIIEDLLAFHDRELLEHFVKLNVSSQIYAWTIMQNEWARVLDHLLVNPPAFLLHFIVAYQIYFRKALLNCKKIEDFKKFYVHQNALNLSDLMDIARKLKRGTPKILCPSTYFEKFTPLTTGNYPIFNQFPTFIVDYERKVKEKIRQDEDDYLRKRKSTHAVNRLADELERDKKAWESADWKMNDLVEKWWDRLIDVEEDHLERQMRLDARETEQRSKAILKIAEARKTFINQHIANTSQNMKNFKKTHFSNNRSGQILFQQADLDERYKEIENEWLTRRSEMLKARAEISALDRSRTEGIFKNSKNITRDGESDTTGSLNSQSENSKIESKVDERIRQISQIGKTVKFSPLLEQVEVFGGNLSKGFDEEKLVAISKPSLTSPLEEIEKFNRDKDEKTLHNPNYNHLDDIIKRVSRLRTFSDQEEIQISEKRTNYDIPDIKFEETTKNSSNQTLELKTNSNSMAPNQLMQKDKQNFEKKEPKFDLSANSNISPSDNFFFDQNFSKIDLENSNITTEIKKFLNQMAEKPSDSKFKYTSNIVPFATEPPIKQAFSSSTFLEQINLGIPLKQSFDIARKSQTTEKSNIVDNSAKKKKSQL
ncbi:TBC1 domain member 31, partial [Nowakowskiella sp. JEL0078]